MPTVVVLGNPCAREAYRDPTSDDPEKVRYRNLEGELTTEVFIPDGESLAHSFASVIDVVNRHFQEPVPAWIDCSAPGLGALLLEHFQPKAKGSIQIGRPPGWGGTDYSPLGSYFSDEGWGPADLLRTTVGRDWQCRVMAEVGGTAGTGNWAPASFMGFTNNNADPNLASTALTGEIGSGTLVRGACIYGHTPTSNNYTLTRTVTSDQAVTINKIGIFTAVSGGVMVFESRLNAPAVLANLDQCTFTETVTL